MSFSVMVQIFMRTIDYPLYKKVGLSRGTGSAVTAGVFFSGVVHVSYCT